MGLMSFGEMRFIHWCHRSWCRNIDNWETFKHLLSDSKQQKDCTQTAATKLYKALMTSLGYIWPNGGYQSEPKKVKISLDARALTYKNSLL
ncbi:hypothetical protein VCRA2119O48_140104 [Vibrio crassostreae]|nr:hypothetical protein VCRA2119O48_140104 [Vibrio crassostreae]CAK3774225.1 hypothetical protein VCRA212O16_140011 [Vibrio crassostreae]